MKKFFYSVLAAATMLFTATSCSQDDEMVGGGTVDNGTTQKVTFTVQMPDEGVASRAIADGVNVGGGNKADNLIWALYEKGKDNVRLDFGHVTGEKNTETGKHEFTADISVVKGLEYNILFFAYDDEKCVFQLNTVDPDLTALTLKTDLVANEEGYDAFVKCHPYKTGGETDVTLKRPFAQINAATTVADLDKALKLQAVVTKSELVIKDVPTQYNVLTEEATENKDRTYSANDILKHFVATGETAPTHPNEDITVDNVGYKYLAMAYVLAGATKDSEESMHEATFNFYRGTNGDDLMRTIDIPSLPIQRNHRTNVIGDLLTETESFKIVIDEKFDGEHNIYEGGSSVTTAEDLQTAINAATSGLNIIKFAADITGNVTIEQKQNVDLVIDGCGYKFDGVMTVNGKGRHAGKETLKFTNINFSTEHTADTKESEWQFITAPSKINEAYNYSHNVTIENCTFENTVSGILRVGGAAFTGTYNLAMRNCTATNMHSILQVQSCDNTVVVDNIKTIGCKNGVSFGNTANPTISNSEINSNAYGIRGDGNATRGNLVIKNTSINANVPVVIRKVTTDGYKVNLDENTVLKAGQLYDVVFTSGDDEAAYVEPAKTWSIEGADNYNVFPMKEGAAMNASSNAQLSAAIAAGATEIHLNGSEIKMPSNGNVTGNIKIVGDGTTTVDVTKGAYMDKATLTFENVNIKTSTGYVYDDNGKQGSDYAALYTPNVTYTKCNFSGPMRVGRDGAKFIECTFSDLGNDYVWTYGNDVTFEGCTFNTKGKAILIYSDGGDEISRVSVTGCTFNATQGAKAGAIANQNCAAIEIHNYGNGVKLTTSDNTVGENFSGEWRIKTYETGRTQVFVNETEYTSIAIDGKTMTIDANKNVTVNE